MEQPPFASRPTLSRGIAGGRESLTEAGVQTRHYQTNTVLTETANGRITGRTMLLLLWQRHGETAPAIMVSGVYHDEFVKTTAGWRIASRRVKFDQGSAPPVPTSR